MTKLSKKYIWWGSLGTLIQYGVPLSYIVYRYDIFKFEEAQNSLTGWGIIGIGVIFFMFRNKLKMMVEDYNKHLGMTGQKGKWGIAFFTMFGILALSTLWINGMMWFMFTLGVSNLASLPAYSKFYIGKKEYQDDVEFIKVKKREDKLKGLTV